MTLQHRQGRLFDAGKYEAERSYEPGVWDNRPDTVWHGSDSFVMPVEDWGSSSTMGEGFHVGTKAAAIDRIMSTHGNSQQKTVHPLRISGQFALPPDRVDPEDNGWSMVTDSYKARPMSHDVYGSKLTTPKDPLAWDDEAANYSSRAQHGVEVRGRNVPYVNNAESPGSVSIRAPRENLHTWDEDVESDPNAPTWAKAHVAYGYNLSHPMGTQGSDMPKHPDWNVNEALPGLYDSTGVHYTTDRAEMYKQHEAKVEYAKGTKPRLRRP